MNPASPTQARYKFPVPEETAALNDPPIRTLHLRLLSGDDELLAAKKARGASTEFGSQFSLAHELAKLSLVAINGKDVRTEDGSVDAAWSKMHAQIRTLVMRAYAKLHTPKEEVAEDFLKGMTIEA